MIQKTVNVQLLHLIQVRFLVLIFLFEYIIIPLTRGENLTALSASGESITAHTQKHKSIAAPSKTARIFNPPTVTAQIYNINGIDTIIESPIYFDQTISKEKN